MLLRGNPYGVKNNLKGDLLLRGNPYGVMILVGKKWWEGCGRDMRGMWVGGGRDMGGVWVGCGRGKRENFA